MKAFIKAMKSRWSKGMQNEITAGLSTPRGNQSWGYRKKLPSIKWTVWKTLPHHQGLLHASRCRLDSQSVDLCCTLCSAHPQWPPHYALDNHKSQNDCYGDLSNFSKLHVFGSICYALQLQSFFVSWRKDQQKDSFLGSTCWLQSLEPTKKVKVLDGKFLSTEENQIHGLCREEEPSHSLQWPRERVSTANFTHARML